MILKTWKTVMLALFGLGACNGDSLGSLEPIPQTVAWAPTADRQGGGSNHSVYSGDRAIRIWFNPSRELPVSRFLGTFSPGDTVTVKFAHKAEIGTGARLVLAGRRRSGDRDETVWSLPSGGDKWLVQTASRPVAAAESVWLQLYGGSGAAGTVPSSVLVDDVSAASQQQGSLFSDDFELRSPTSSDSAGVSGFFDFVTASTSRAYNGLNALALRSGPDSTSAVTRFLGQTERPETVSVIARFKALPGDTVRLFIASDARRTVTLQKGDGSWQSLSTTHIARRGEKLWVGVGTTTQSETLVDDVAVWIGARHAWTDTFESRFDVALDSRNRAQWFAPRQNVAVVGTIPVALWQLRSASNAQMNSYVLRTSAGRLIVLDGGFDHDAQMLMAFIAERGNVVDAWFVSHLHSDHVGALTRILEQKARDPSFGPQINKVYGSIPDSAEMLTGHLYPQDFPDRRKFLDALAGAQMTVTPVQAGDTIGIDNAFFEILWAKTAAVYSNRVNNSSVVMRLWDGNKSVLFLGDLGLHGGNLFLETSPLRARLPSDYVQMAHHGQGGVGENFYAAVRPRYCLWPTPAWLFNYPSTQAVYGWMQKLGVERHFLMSQGIVGIDTMPR